MALINRKYEMVFNTLLFSKKMSYKSNSFGLIMFKSIDYV